MDKKMFRRQTLKSFCSLKKIYVLIKQIETEPEENLD